MFRRVRLPAIGYYRASNAFLTRTGIVTAEERAVSLQACGPLPRTHGACPLRELTGTSVLFDERLDSRWQNWLLDIPYRLWVLHRGGFDLHALRYVLSSEIAPVAGDVLSALGIGRESIELFDAQNEQLLVGDVVVPTAMRSRDGLSPMVHDALDFHDRRIAMPLREAGEGFRVFAVTRRGAQGHLDNGPELAEMAEQFGYRVLDLDTDPMDEHKRVLSNAAASVVVGDHTSLPCFPRKRGSVVCSLLNADCAAGSVPSSIATVPDQHVGYVFGSNARQGGERDDFRIEPDDFEHALRITELYAGL